MNMHELLPWFYKLTPSQLFHVALHMWSSLLSLLAIFCKLLSQSSSGFSKRAVSVNLMRVHWFRRRVLCSSTWCCLLTLEAWGYRAKPLKKQWQKWQTSSGSHLRGTWAGTPASCGSASITGIGRVLLPPTLSFSVGRCGSCREQQALCVELFFDTATWTGVMES